MAPIEELHSKDLAWISDFVMQQMVMMLRPMMEHLHETDAACDYAQRLAQRASLDVSEVRSDLERTNRYLAILRQGLGFQNEGKCVLQRSIETSTRTVKRLDTQMDSVSAVMRSVEDSIKQLASDAKGEKERQEDLAQQVLASSATLEELQVAVERLAGETHNALMNATMPWPPQPKKNLATVEPPVSIGITSNAVAPPMSAHEASRSGGGPGDCHNHSCSSQQSNRRGTCRTGSASGGGLRVPQACAQEHLEFSTGTVTSRSGSRTAVWEQREGDEAALTVPSRLPVLASTRQGGGAPSRPADRSGTSSDAGHRLRFTATMAKPESRGKPS